MNLEKQNTPEVPSIKMTHAAVKVSSIQKSLEFFNATLGLKTAWGGQEDWGLLKMNGSTLAVIEKNHEVHPPHIGFVVAKKEDVDLYYQKLKTSGARDVEEPRDHRDKSRSFYFKDPDGNQFELLWIPEHLTK